MNDEEKEAKRIYEDEVQIDMNKYVHNLLNENQEAWLHEWQRAPIIRPKLEIIEERQNKLKKEINETMKKVTHLNTKLTYELIIDIDDYPTIRRYVRCSGDCNKIQCLKLPFETHKIIKGPKYTHHYVQYEHSMPTESTVSFEFDNIYHKLINNIQRKLEKDNNKRVISIEWDDDIVILVIYLHKLININSFKFIENYLRNRLPQCKDFLYKEIKK